MPLETLPVSVLFVMDLSQSVTRERRQRLAAAARQFSGQLSENDRCAVMIFSAQPVLTHDFAGCSELPRESVPGGAASSAARRSGTRCCFPPRLPRRNPDGPSSSSSPTATTP